MEVTRGYVNATSLGKSLVQQSDIYDGSVWHFPVFHRCAVKLPYKCNLY